MNNSCNNSGKKEVSDITSDMLLKGECSGMEKFDHDKESMLEALKITQEDENRIKDVVTNLKPPFSRSLETILITDKLHSTKERLVATFIFGGTVGMSKSAEMTAKLLTRLMGDGGL